MSFALQFVKTVPALLATEKNVIQLLTLGSRYTYPPAMFYCLKRIGFPLQFDRNRILSVATRARVVGATATSFDEALSRIWDAKSDLEAFLVPGLRGWHEGSMISQMQVGHGDFFEPNIGISLKSQWHLARRKACKQNVSTFCRGNC